jgi:hypothetical protein
MRARWNRHGLGHIDSAGSLLSVDSPAFVVSAIKRAEDGDGIIVRLYNTLDEEASTTVDLPAAPGGVSMVNLNEEHIDDIERDEDGVEITARRNEIVRFDSGGRLRSTSPQNLRRARSSNRSRGRLRSIKCTLTPPLDSLGAPPLHSDHFEIDRRRSGLVRLAGEPTREPGLVKSGGGATDRMDLGASDRTP